MTGQTGREWSEARRNALPWDEHRKAKLRMMWDRGDSVANIALELGTSRGAIYVKANDLGLSRRAPYGRSGTTHKRKANGERRFSGIQPKGRSRIRLAAHHPASREGATIYPSMVIPASQMTRLLKSGQNNRKIGGTVAKGRFRGLPIFTLTLEERETCPRGDCPVWDSCYGNGMHMAQRISDDGTLIRRLWAELAVLNIEHRAGFLIRLHVLGDFYSEEYVGLWRQAMSDFPRMRIFGFTSRRPPDPIGIAVVELARDFYDRFRMRFSGLAMPEDGAVVIDRPEDAIGTLCPAEADPARCCATCALCWHSNRTISFLRH